MSLVVRLLGMLMGFATVMLTASLVVMCIVRGLQYLANTRGKTLGEMLGSLNLGFRFSQGDSARAGDEATSSFVLDILTYPALHPRSQLGQFEPNNDSPATIREKRENLAQRIDYLPKDQLKDIVRRLAAAEAQAPDWADDDTLVLPARWFNHLSTEKRSLDAFFEYVDSWYSTVEDVSTQSFKLTSRRMTGTVSCVLVVFLNLDALQLASDLVRADPAALDQLAVDSETVLKTSDRMLTTTSPPTDRDALVTGTTSTVQQLNGVLVEPSLSLGWQSSWIVKKWIDAGSGKSSWAFWAVFPYLSTVRWFAGLVVSCLLLSLGAPFWADRLKDVLNFRNALEPEPAPRGRGDDAAKTA